MRKILGLFIVLLILFCAQTVLAETGAVMSHSEFDAAPLDSTVTVETYVQAYLNWEEDYVSAYAQGPDGVYYISQMAYSPYDSYYMEPGVKICVTGTKTVSAGRIQISDATFEFAGGDPFIAAARDVTGLLGTDGLQQYMNEFVLIEGLTVVPSSPEGSDEETAFLFGRDGYGSWGDDLYFSASLNGQVYTFCVESSLCDPDTDVYNEVEALTIGDVINMEGFLNWNNGAEPSLTYLHVTLAADRPVDAEELSIDIPVNVRIENAYEHVFFSFTPEVSKFYAFSSSGDVDSYAELFDVGMNLLAYNDDGGNDYNFRLEYYLEAGRQYFFSARCYFGTTGEYSAVLSASEYVLIEGYVNDSVTHFGIADAIVTFNDYSVETDYFGYYSFWIEPGTGVLSCSRQFYYPSEGVEMSTEAGGYYSVDFSLNMYDVLPLTLGTVTQAKIQEPGETVLYRFIPEEDGIYHLISSSDGDPYVSLYDTELVFILDDDNSGEDNNFHLSAILNSDDTYYFCVQFADDSVTGTIPFTLTYQSFSILNGHVTDADTNEYLQNVRVSFGDSFCYTDDAGYFELAVPSGTSDLLFQLSNYDDCVYADISIDVGETITIDAQMSWAIPARAVLLEEDSVTAGSVYLLDPIYYRFSPDSTATYHFYIAGSNHPDLSVITQNRDWVEPDSNEYNSILQHTTFTLEAGTDYYFILNPSESGSFRMLITRQNTAILAGYVLNADGSGNISGTVVTYGNDSTVAEYDGLYMFAFSSSRTAAMTFTKDGFIPANYENIAVQLNSYTEQNAVMTRILGEDEYRVVLTWGETPSDLDSHLLGPGYHVFYSNMQAENANLDVDDTTSYGPETVTFTADSDKLYTYYVHDYTNGDNPSSDAMANSGAVVKIYRGNSLIATRSVPSRAGIYWTVFTVRNGQLSFSDRVSGDSPNDLQTISFELPAHLRVIEEEAFAGCDFSTVLLHDGVTSIGSKAFSNCHELDQIVIPASVTYIADDAFAGSTGFTIFCPDGSYAEAYAAAHGITCITQ